MGLLDEHGREGMLTLRETVRGQTLPHLQICADEGVHNTHFCRQHGGNSAAYTAFPNMLFMPRYFQT